MSLYHNSLVYYAKSLQKNQAELERNPNRRCPIASCASEKGITYTGRSQGVQVDALMHRTTVTGGHACDTLGVAFLVVRSGSITQTSSKPLWLQSRVLERKVSPGAYLRVTHLS